MEGLPEKTFTEKPFDDITQNKIHFLAQTKQTRETHGP